MTEKKNIVKKRIHFGKSYLDEIDFLFEYFNNKNLLFKFDFYIRTLDKQLPLKKINLLPITSRERLNKELKLLNFHFRQN